MVVASSRYEMKEHGKLNVMKVEVSGSVVKTLFASGAIPDTMSAGLGPRLRLSPRPTQRRITIVDSREPNVLVEVTGISITKEELSTTFSCPAARSL